MFEIAVFNQNLCAWASKSPQLNVVGGMFFLSACTNPSAPVLNNGTLGDPHDGPFCFTCLSGNPSDAPTQSIGPSRGPSYSPSVSVAPSSVPSISPSVSIAPSIDPSNTPTPKPTDNPSIATYYPSEMPSSLPSTTCELVHDCTVSSGNRGIPVNVSGVDFKNAIRSHLNGTLIYGNTITCWD
eukprot:scaffold428964_cov318-Attheya_sp.AAC.1